MTSIRKLAVLLFHILPYDIEKKIEVFIYRYLLKKNNNLYAYFIKKNNNSHNKYCIFRFCRPDLSLFSAACEYIFRAEFAKKKGFIPLIDIEFKDVFRRGELFEANMWDLVFSQYEETQDVIDGKNYVVVEMVGGILSVDELTCKKINKRADVHNIMIVENNWRDYYKKTNELANKYWRIKPEILQICDKFIQDNFADTDVVLGIMLREEFSSKVYDAVEGENKRILLEHPILPELDEIIEIIKKLMKKWKCNKLFISTMYKSSVELFAKEFDNSLYYVNRKFRLDAGEDKTRIDRNLTDKQQYEQYCKNKQMYDDEIKRYVCDTVILSKLNYFAVTHCRGSAAALTINGGNYVDVFFIENKRDSPLY